MYPDTTCTSQTTQHSKKWPRWLPLPIFDYKLPGSNLVGGGGGGGTEGRGAENSSQDCMALYFTAPFIFTLPSFQYDL